MHHSGMLIGLLNLMMGLGLKDVGVRLLWLVRSESLRHGYPLLTLDACGCSYKELGSLREDSFWFLASGFRVWGSKWLL